MKSKLLTALTSILCCLTLCVSSAMAFTTSDYNCADQGNNGGTCFYDPTCGSDTVDTTTGSLSTTNASSSCSCSTSSGTSSTSSSVTITGSGTLPSSVPAPYNAIFTAAANKFDVAPALVAGIFYGGEHANSFPAPPPPYGNGSPWASSSAGAQGPFQFEPATWAAYGVNASGHPGAPDVEDLEDGAFGAANYLAASGAKGSTALADLTKAIFAYNHLQSYVNDVLAAYAKFGGATSGTGNGSSTLSQTSAASDGSSNGCSSSGDSSGSGSTASCSSPTGSSTVSGDAAILCEAEQYNGVYYQLGGGHQGYSAFIKDCPSNSISSAAQASTPGLPGPCATDCSGLVSVAMDQAFSANYNWTVNGDGKMIDGNSSTDSGDWQSIPFSQVKAGDIVTNTSSPGDPYGHVEIVESLNGDTLTTFGSHYPGAQTNKVTSPTSYWAGGAYTWNGPGSNNVGS